MLALALERVGARDSAAVTYARAAALLPGIAGWLRIRAAAVTDDSARAARLYAGVTDPLARDRIGWSEAAASRGTGDLVGAAARYAALGARATACAPPARLEPRQRPSGRPSGRSSSPWCPPAGARARCGTPWRCSTARSRRSPRPKSWRSAGPAPRRAATPAPLTGSSAPSRLGSARPRTGSRSPLSSPSSGATPRRRGSSAWCTRPGRWRPRRRTRAPGPWYGMASWRRAPRPRAGGAPVPAGHHGRLVRTVPAGRSRHRRPGRRRSARDAVPPGRRALPEQPVRAHGRLPRGDDRAGRGRREGRRPPSSTGSAGATPRSDERPRRRTGPAERGRPWATAPPPTSDGRRLAAGDPGSYYTGLADRPARPPEWAPPAAADSFIAIPAADSAMARAALLARLGLAAESRWEYDRLLRQSDTSSERLLALAARVPARGFASQAIQLARRALALGAPADARTYRLLYPVMLEDALLAEAAGRGSTPPSSPRSSARNPCSIRWRRRRSGRAD